jgi:hypothetical protein
MNICLKASVFLSFVGAVTLGVSASCQVVSTATYDSLFASGMLSPYIVTEGMRSIAATAGFYLVLFGVALATGYFKYLEFKRGKN